MLLFCCYILSDVAQNFSIVVVTLLQQLLSDFEYLQHMFLLLKLFGYRFQPLLLYSRCYQLLLWSFVMHLMLLFTETIVV